MNATETSRRRPIIVLGAERSGTSVVAEMVHRWGAYAGEPEKMHQADEHNPQGYWEYLPIWDFLTELGDFAAGASWWDCSFPQRVEEKLSLAQYRDKALELVAVMQKEGKPWFWKDPALSFFLPFWKAIWGDAAYIIMVRNPYDTALSWQKFVMPSKLEDSVSLIAGNLLRWQYMMSLILEHTEETENKIFIPYEDVVREPQKQADRLGEFLNLNYAVGTPDEITLQEMARVVHPELWRQRSLVPFEQVHQATVEQKNLYQFAERKVQNPLGKFEMAEYPMHPGWREFVKNGEALMRAHRPD